MSARIARLVKVLGGVAVLAFLLAACSNVGPQDTLNPDGPVAQRELDLFVPVFWIAAAIFVLVEGAIVAALIRFRAKRRAESPVQIHGNQRLEIGWTLAPAVLLAGIAGPTVFTIIDLAREPKGADVVQVEVVGHQWWWEYRYTEEKFNTANELVIPTGAPVHLKVTSDDVIHSFWVPKLAGKQDAVPGRHNPLTLKATKPGVYWGQCAEFCALSHANMRLRVVAKTPAEYENWVAGQKADAAAAALATEGARIFQNFAAGSQSCVACHTVRGIPNAGGIVGPELTHFASRATFAGSMFPRDAAHVTAWLDDPPEQKPGSIMPDLNLSNDMIAKLVDFLMRLS